MINVIIGGLVALGVGVVVVVILYAFGAMFLGQIATQPAVNNSTGASGIVAAGQTVLASTFNWTQTLVLVAVFALAIFGLLYAVGSINMGGGGMGGSGQGGSA